MLLPKPRTAKGTPRWAGEELTLYSHRTGPAFPAVTPLGGNQNGVCVVRMERTTIDCSQDPLHSNIATSNPDYERLTSHPQVPLCPAIGTAQDEGS